MEKLSKLVDHWLQPVVHSLPSFIQDTTHFLQMNEQWKRTYEPPPVPPDALTQSLDVVGLYSNIPHHEVTTSLMETLGNEHLETQAPPTHLLLEIVEHILCNNVFEFKRNFQANLGDSNGHTHYQCLHGLIRATAIITITMAH